MRLLNKRSFVLFLLILSACKGQDSKPLVVEADLPKLLKESSGIEALENSNTFWLINDSGNSNELFEVSPKGKITRAVTVTNAKNTDWEDLATDGTSQLFIGDFGNNDNYRKDLCIYTVNSDAIQGNTVEAQQKTSFTFEDQKKFPPKKKHRNFDVEAFVYLNNHFYLFTKNRSSEFDGTTNLYKVPAQNGEYIAKKIGNFKTCNDATDCLVTSAALSKDQKTLVLLTHNKIFKFSDFSGDDFFNGKLETIKLHHKTQKEAICFKDGVMYLTDEASHGEGGNLYKLKTN